MELVQQPKGSGLCMACCVAMITGDLLDTVLEKSRILHGEDGTKYLPTSEAIKYLARRMLSYGLSLKPHEPVVTNATHLVVELRVTEFPAILTVPSVNFPGYTHAVVWDNAERCVLDPLRSEPQLLEYYAEISEWTPITPIDC